MSGWRSTRLVVVEVTVGLPGSGLTRESADGQLSL